MDARVRTCLWFEAEGEEAGRSYVSLLADSEIGLQIGEMK